MEDVASLVLTLSFDPSIVQVKDVKDVKEGSFMSSDGVKTAFLGNLDNTTGEIQIGITREGFGKGVSGTGEIVSIIFESLKEGQTAISLASGTLRSPLLLEIPASFREAEVIIK